MADAITYVSAQNLVNQVSEALTSLNNRVYGVECTVGEVKNDVKVLNRDLQILHTELAKFVDKQLRANSIQQAQMRIVELNQDLEQNFGHYAEVRKTAVGILQATDLEIVKKTTIEDYAEELMLKTPRYWLTPALIALSAWISNKKPLAERALKEALRRDDEKTSLFFSLICRRADRKNSCYKWLERYLGNQDEENLDRKAVIVLDAYVNGLFGADTEGLVFKRMSQWLENLSAKPGFSESQKEQWTDAINLKKPVLDENMYEFLRQYSPDWDIIESTVQGACLNDVFYDYLKNIFDKVPSCGPLKEQLDDILDSLVTNYDDEELPIYKELRLKQLIIECAGDENEAKHRNQLEESGFEISKSYTQLLTDAAMKGEVVSSTVATKKFAIAMSKAEILNAFNDILAKNRASVPVDINFEIDAFRTRTVDGSNEAEILKAYGEFVNNEKRAVLDKLVLDGFVQFCQYGCYAVGAIGVGMILSGSVFMGCLAAVAGVGMFVKYKSNIKNIEAQRKFVEEEYAKKTESGRTIIRALLADVVDYRRYFDKKDKESEKVITFLTQISPDQYVTRLAGDTRRVL